MDIEISKYGERLIKRIKRGPKNILDNLVLKFKDSNGEWLKRALIDNNISGSKLEISILAKLYLSFAVEGHHYLFGIGRKDVSILIYKNEEDEEFELEENIELNLAAYSDEYELLVAIINKFFYYSKLIHSPEFIMMKNKEGAMEIKEKLKKYVWSGILVQILWVALESIFPILFIYTDFTESILGLLITIIFSLPLPIVGILDLRQTIYYIPAYKKLKKDIDEDKPIKIMGRPTNVKYIANGGTEKAFTYTRIDFVIDGVKLHYIPPYVFNLDHSFRAEFKRAFKKSLLKLEYYPNSKIINYSHSNINKIVFDKLDELRRPY